MMNDEWIELFLAVAQMGIGLIRGGMLSAQ